MTDQFTETIEIFEKLPFYYLDFLREIEANIKSSYSLSESDLNNAFILCLKDGRKPIAYGEFQIILDEVHLNRLATNPVDQKRGIATRLLEKAFSKYPQAHFFLEVSSQNGNALKLYSKMGFKIIGTRTNYYGNGDNAIVMSRQVS